jgi:hypothetical protein
MAVTSDALLGIDVVPWSRLVHFYGRATEIPRTIRELDTDNHAKAQERLLGWLEHQDGVTQATPFAVLFILKMLNAGAVRDPAGVRRLIGVLQTSARFQLQCCNKPGTPMDWNTLLTEEHLWPEFKSERDDEIHWEEWQPGIDEWYSWPALTDQLITQGLSG